MLSLSYSAFLLLMSSEATIFMEELSALDLKKANALLLSGLNLILNYSMLRIMKMKFFKAHLVRNQKTMAMQATTMTGRTFSLWTPLTLKILG